MKTRTYFIFALVILCVEVGIALWITHSFIRGFLGDILVVLLIYTALRSLKINFKYLCELVLAFAITIEILQAFQFYNWLGIDSKILKVIIGSVFDWLDILAYFIGYLICKRLRNLENKKSHLN